MAEQDATQAGSANAAGASQGEVQPSTGSEGQQTPQAPPGYSIIRTELIPTEYRNDPYNLIAAAKLGKSLKDRGFDTLGDTASGYEIKAMMDKLSPHFPGASPAEIGSMISEVMAETGQTVEEATETVTNHLSQQPQRPAQQSYHGQPPPPQSGQPNFRDWAEYEAWVDKKAEARAKALLNQYKAEQTQQSKQSEREARKADRVRQENAALDATLKKYGIAPNPTKVQISGRDVEVDPVAGQAREFLRAMAWQEHQRRIDPHDPDRDVKLAGMDEAVIEEVAGQLLPLLKGGTQAALAQEAARQEQVPAQTLVETPGGRTQKQMKDMTDEEFEKAAMNDVRQILRNRGGPLDMT